jgi:hypothetical protein
MKNGLNALACLGIVASCLASTNAFALRLIEMPARAGYPIRNQTPAGTLVNMSGATQCFNDNNYGSPGVHKNGAIAFFPSTCAETSAWWQMPIPGDFNYSAVSSYTQYVSVNVYATSSINLLAFDTYDNSGVPFAGDSEITKFTGAYPMDATMPEYGYGQIRVLMTSSAQGILSYAYIANH